VLAVNEEIKRIQTRYLEQQQLTKNVKEDKQKLVQSFKKLMAEQGTAWKNTQSLAGATVCFKDVPRLRVE